MSRSNPDHIEGDKARWKNTALEYRDQAYIALAQASEHTNPTNQIINPPSINQLAHAYTLNYADQIRPKWQDLPEKQQHPTTEEKLDKPRNIWENKITTIETPKPGTYQAGTPNRYGEFQADISTADTELRPVAPQTLNQYWADQEITITLTSTNNEITDTHTFKIYLPLNTTRKLLNYLDICMNELGWLPDSQQTEQVKDLPHPSEI